jgi:hypothetical protein
MPPPVAIEPMETDVAVMLKSWVVVRL